MNSSKQYWLAGAAALVSVTGAQAADLPFRKAAPVDYVRVCDAFGAGFFYIPGTDTCLRVTGQVRAEYSFRGNAPTDNPAASAYNQAGAQYRRDLTNFRARGYLNVDVRTQTAYGALRAFASIRETIDTTAPGPLGGRGILGVAGVPAGVRASTGLFQGFNPTGTQSTLDKGFIQFAGLTAGRTQSFFDFDAQSYELLTNTVANSNQGTQMLAYTATFGGGFSATVSVEDANERRLGDNGAFVYSTFNPAAAVIPAANPLAPTQISGNINSPLTTVNAAGAVTGQTAGVLAYGGERVPDIVANVRYDAAWGSAQISGAYHEINSVPVASLTRNSTTGAVTSSATRGPSADGFAVIGGVKILLPTLAKGDSLTLQGTYEEGAMDYANSVNYLPVGLSNVYNNTIGVPGGAASVGQTFGVPLNDAFVLTNGRIAKNTAVGGFGAFRHYFIPEVYGSVYGTYLQITNPTQAQRLGAGTDSARIFQVGGNLVWTPVKDFQIGAEVLYTNLRYESNTDGLCYSAACGRPGGLAPGGVYAGAASNQEPDDYRARLSLRRAF